MEKRLQKNRKWSKVLVIGDLFFEKWGDIIGTFVKKAKKNCGLGVSIDDGRAFAIM